jgi:hypothetical protein
LSRSSRSSETARATVALTERLGGVASTTERERSKIGGHPRKAGYYNFSMSDTDINGVAAPTAIPSEVVFDFAEAETPT